MFSRCSHHVLTRLHPRCDNVLTRFSYLRRDLVFCALAVACGLCSFWYFGRVVLAVLTWFSLGRLLVRPVFCWRLGAVLRLFVPVLSMQMSLAPIMRRFGLYLTGSGDHEDYEHWLLHQ